MLVVSLSGGKDSTALALYMKDKIDLLLFCDTGIELPETYQYIKKVQKYINKPLITLKNQSFQFWINHWKGFLPNSNTRWCTRTLKIIPFEKFLNENKNAIVAVGLRADEEKRRGYLGLYQANYIYPFRDADIKKDGVDELLKDFGIPEFYKWKSRSGCCACPFLRKSEWEGLYKNHPDLFKWAESIEKSKNYKYTWNKNYSLKDIREIVEGKKMQLSLFDEDESACTICTL